MPVDIKTKQREILADVNSILRRRTSVLVTVIESTLYIFTDGKEGEAITQLALESSIRGKLV